LTLVETGIGGSDTLNATGTAAAEAFVWNGSTLANGSDTISGAANIESVVLTGNGGADSLTGADANQTWTLSAASAGSVGVLSFSQNASLTGGIRHDACVFDAVVAGGGSISGGGGSNGLDVSACTPGVTAGLAAGTSIQVAGVFSNGQALT